MREHHPSEVKGGIIIIFLGLHTTLRAFGYNNKDADADASSTSYLLLFCRLSREGDDESSTNELLVRFPGVNSFCSSICSSASRMLPDDDEEEACFSSFCSTGLRLPSSPFGPDKGV